MNKRNVKVNRDRSQAARGGSQERVKTKKPQREESHKENKNKEYDNYREGSPLKRFLHLRLGQTYSMQLTEMLKLLTVENMTKTMIEDQAQPQQKFKLQARVKFLKYQQEQLIQKLNVESDSSNANNAPQCLLSLFKSLGLSNGMQISDKLMCMQIKSAFQRKEKALSTIFHHLQCLVTEKSEQKNQSSYSFKDIMTKLRKCLEVSRKNKQNTNEYMRKVLQLEKNNIKLAKDCRKIEQQFQYLVEEKLLLENKLDRAHSMVNSMEEERQLLKNSITKRLIFVSSALCNLKEEHASLKGDLQNRQIRFHIADQLEKTLCQIALGEQRQRQLGDRVEQLQKNIQQLLKNNPQLQNNPSQKHCKDTKEVGCEAQEHSLLQKEIALLRSNLHQLRNQKQALQEKVQEINCQCQASKVENNILLQQRQLGMQKLQLLTEQINQLSTSNKSQKQSIATLQKSTRIAQEKMENGQYLKQNLIREKEELSKTISQLNQELQRVKNCLSQRQLDFGSQEVCRNQQLANIKIQLESLSAKLIVAEDAMSCQEDEARLFKLLQFLYRTSFNKKASEIRQKEMEAESLVNRLNEKEKELNDIKDQIKTCSQSWSNKEHELTEEISKTQCQYSNKEQAALLKIQQLQEYIKRLMDEIKEEKNLSSQLKTKLQDGQIKTVELCKLCLEQINDNFLQKTHTLEKMHFQIISTVKDKISKLQQKQTTFSTKYAKRMRKAPANLIQQRSNQKDNLSIKVIEQDQCEFQVPVFNLTSQQISKQNSDASQNSIILSQSCVWNFMNQQIINEEVALVKVQLDRCLHENQCLRKRLLSLTDEKTENQQLILDFC